MLVTCISEDKNSVNIQFDQDKAIEEICVACNNVQATVRFLTYEEVSHGLTETLDFVYNSDVLIVDMSDKTQQGHLNYQLGVRESLKLFDNIVIVNLSSHILLDDLRSILSSKTKLLPYVINENGFAVLVEDKFLQNALIDNDILKNQICGDLGRLSEELEEILSEMCSGDRAPLKDKFIEDLRRDRDLYKGQELRERLRVMRRRLDYPGMLSSDVILNLLLSYRQCEDFDAMVTLIEEIRALKLNQDILNVCMIQYLYAFALHRRNKNGDRDAALAVTEEILKTCGKPSADMYGLFGRIQKDRFMDSHGEDKEALDLAIQGYREGLKIDANEYLLVNVATLLVIKGMDLETSAEMRKICNTLNLRVGQKGNISTINDYWDVATLFEVRVISEDYAGAVQAVERMYLLDPPDWELESTLGNIKMICKFRKPPEENKIAKPQKLFDFWMEFLSTVCDTDESDSFLISSDETEYDSFIRPYESYTKRIVYPVLVTEQNCTVMKPANIQVNINAVPRNLRVIFYDLDYTISTTVQSVDLQNCGTMRQHFPRFNEHSQEEDLIFNAEDIIGISMTENNSRSVYLYTTCSLPNYRISFSCEKVKMQFYTVLRDCLFSEEENSGLLLDEHSSEPFKWTYDLNDRNEREILGRGSFGVVYTGWDLTKQIKMAIKEIDAVNIREFQPLHDEIRLHSRLHHKNIVQYFGSVDHEGVFMIFMELVPGASLTSLVSKYGALKEETVANYSKQILEGLQYLHANRIIHRDIKGDNILVNMYKGELKITDFGASKRLAGLIPRAQTFKGTMRYMAPELIRGCCGFPADIWSFGCTVVEMLTGKQPFSELGNAMTALYRVGMDLQHPKIPDGVSVACKNFILKTFIIEPSNRASANELLSDQFILRSLSNISNQSTSPVIISGSGSWGSKSNRLLNVIHNSNSILSESEKSDNDASSVFSNESFHQFNLKNQIIDQAENRNTDGEKHSTESVNHISILPVKVEKLKIPGVYITKDEKRKAPVNSASFGNSEDPFNFIKQDSEAKRRLSNALISEKQSIVDAWIDIVCRCTQSNVSNKTKDELISDLGKRVNNSETNRESNNGVEKKLLECLLDMITDSLHGGICWSQLVNYLKIPANKCTTEGLTDSINGISGDTNKFAVLSSLKRYSVAGEDLGGRFLKLLHSSKISEQNNACLPVGTPLVCNYLRVALAALPSVIAAPLLRQVNRPHEVLAWEKLIKDAITSATNQISNLAPISTVHLRRHQTYSAQHNRRLVKQVTTEADLDSPTYIRQSTPSNRPFTMVSMSPSLYYTPNDSVVDETKKVTNSLSLSQKSLTFSNEAIPEEPMEIIQCARKFAGVQSSAPLCHVKSRTSKTLDELVNHENSANGLVDKNNTIKLLNLISMYNILGHKCKFRIIVFIIIFVLLCRF
ncbi:mitogen-activated protein kinase kinase kinase 5 [Schistosoma bovis]|uniref:Mitogen-activated protein kinase kinase kinase 5 n=1 Tax=Schistosoma bovis TaxID=6184 RepID=A0A430QRP0_SCHBO|nr:mitogen-activated protein kinase kinase kinase 5 [Schistosoma bovis]